MSAPPQQFVTLIQQQSECAAQLHNTLLAEAAALTARDIEAIQRHALEKSEQTGRMEQLAQEQRRLLEGAGLPFSAEGFSTFIDRLAPALAAKLHQAQQQLKTALEACQRQNLVNGNIIAANRQSAESALAILRGQLSTDNLLYSAAGQTVAAATSKPLLKA